MAAVNVSRYAIPQRWIRYDAAAIFNPLVEAKTAAAVLRQMPYLRQWMRKHTKSSCGWKPPALLE